MYCHRHLQSALCWWPSDLFSRALLDTIERHLQQAVNAIQKWSDIHYNSLESPPIWWNLLTSTSPQTWTIKLVLSNLFREWKQLWDTFTCVGRLICPEGHVSSLCKSNTTNPANRATSPTCLHCDVTHLSLTTGAVALHIPSWRGRECEEIRQACSWAVNAGIMIFRYQNQVYGLPNHHKHIWDNHIYTVAKTVAGTRSPLWRTRLLTPEVVAFHIPFRAKNPRSHVMMIFNSSIGYSHPWQFS